MPPNLLTLLTASHGEVTGPETHRKSVDGSATRL
jgi:hypothetical protein